MKERQHEEETAILIILLSIKIEEIKDGTSS